MINGETDLETNLIIWRKTFGESKRYGDNSDTFLFPVFLVMRYRFTRRETLSQKRRFLITSYKPPGCWIRFSRGILESWIAGAISSSPGLNVPNHSEPSKILPQTPSCRMRCIDVYCTKLLLSHRIMLYRNILRAKKINKFLPRETILISSFYTFSTVILPYYRPTR